ncbi:cyclic nucleotide-binding domain-containing protein [Leptobacterium flavescens]|uniref:Cyclic nucleotide-binding domain-containing protein n=1 Tax=Leptobacterium flavescens TaxID=472055 RepID=A0A6P0UX70_9FLAO|nr:Crp/Fnr family transcriptional regulator [Leptobacterium flavescens]NER15046.1 cyclic nucleotide-binding domain-containing protein [Leptobacterium flavescens]
MSKQFFEHLSKFTEVNENDLEEIMTFFDFHKLGKKEILMEAGTKCTYNHFVLSGCLHMYFINSKGTERTVQFAIENWWITDNLAYLRQAPTDFYIQAVEKTEVLSITHDKQQELLIRFPQLEKYFRIIYQISYGSSLMKMKYIHDLSKEEMYFHFTEHFPEFAQRVPQYLIASFLGLTPEYVSEIRNKKRS